jgi:hypothetical protein
VRGQGIWVVGLAGRRLQRREGYTYRGVIYAMQVTDVVDFRTYFQEFPGRRPQYDGSGHWCRGDAVYSIGEKGAPEMLVCPHSNPDGTPDPGSMATDLGGKYVLISDNFVNFGAEAPYEAFTEGMAKVQGFKKSHTDEVKDAFREWLDGLETSSQESDAVVPDRPGRPASPGGGSSGRCGCGGGE